MNNEGQLVFSVQQVNGGADAHFLYRDRAKKILLSAYPEIKYMKKGGVDRAIYEDFSWSTQVLFLLFCEINGIKNLVGFCSYFPCLVSSVRKEECSHFEWSENEWFDAQFKTLTTGWTVIDPEYQHRGGWSLMMKAFDDSVLKSGMQYVARTVRIANNYSEIVRRRYCDDIVFEKNVFGFGPQVYFRIRIPRE